MGDFGDVDDPGSLGISRLFSHDGAPYPASGGWTPAQPAGQRRFLTFATQRPFSLDGGGTLREVTIAYETWGTLAPDASNAILICHAWTGDSHVAGPAGIGHPTPGWWEGVIGSGRFIDTDRHFVVCTNVLGGCQGTTGPASPHPDDGEPYGLRFPVVTIRDMVRAQTHLADHLGVARWKAVVGGSMGGMQVLEWAITYPHRVGSAVPIATCIESSAQQIAWGAIGRRALLMDPGWNGGDYYGAAPDEGPWRGLAVARMIAQVTFRTDNRFNEKFGRTMRSTNLHGDGLHLFDEFDVEGYLRHHGDKLIRRFDANSYLYIGKAMDLHDVGRARGGVDRAMARISAPVLTLGINSDILYPAYQQQELHRHVAGKDPRTRYVEIDSTEGHDGFLIDEEKVGREIRSFLDEIDQ
jgi:homoserine O-acetyltransferase